MVVDELPGGTKPGDENAQIQLEEPPRRVGILKASPFPSRSASQSSTQEEDISDTKQNVASSQNVVDQLAREMGECCGKSRGGNLLHNT